MAAGEVGIGVVGYGMMGKAHSYAYTVSPVMRSLPYRPRLRVISGRDEAKVSPAAAAGKSVICEKPLAITYAQAASAVASVQRAGVLNAVGFNYRRLPAVSLMKRMVDEGAVGKVRLLRATWLSDEFVDSAIPFDWRFDRSAGGTTIADLGSHLVDMATWMAGDVAEVCGQSETFIRERSKRAVTVDDASSALVRFESGARGVFEMARVAVRRPCDFTIEVNGDSGTLAFEYARLNELLYGEGADRAEL